MKRVVVTGLGAVTPIGNSIEDLWEGVLAGKSGAGPITRFDAEKFRTRFACEVQDFTPKTYLEPAEIRKTDRYAQFALYSATEAMRDSGLDTANISPHDIGVIWGTGQGGMATYEGGFREFIESGNTPRFNPYFISKMIGNLAGGMISMKFGLKGVNFTTMSACATSSTALMEAFNHIHWGKATAIVSGGSEASITEAGVGGFNAMRAMSTSNDIPEAACRPFDILRNGFVMGEGGGALILEEYEHAKKRGAKIYAEILAAEMTSDAHHISAPHPEGEGSARAIKLALKGAGVSPDQIDYINAHATSTPLGDLSEIAAIRSVFGDNPDHLHIGATKSMTGHLLGAAGAVEAILTIKALQTGVLPPTINTTEIDPAIPSQMNIVGKEPRETHPQYAISDNFGFGGHNAILVFKKA